MDAESYMPDLTTVDGCAEEIAIALCSDSSIPVYMSKDKILTALYKDVRKGATLPTKEEIKALVMGADDGEIPKVLVKRYKNTDEALKSYY